MKQGLVYSKTEAGKREIQDRAHKLPAALRSILLMVDGRRDPSQLRELITGLRAPDDALEQLMLKGLIQRSDGALAAQTVNATPAPARADIAAAASHASANASAAVAATTTRQTEATGAVMLPADFGNYRRLHTIVTDAVGRHLGLKGYFMQLKVERCTDVQTLLALLPEIATALSKAKDAKFASEWLARTRLEIRG